MALYLVQHGKSHSKEEDPERSLTYEGQAEAEQMAQIAQESGVKLNAIKHSGKKRAEQTAEIMGKALLQDGQVEQQDGLGATDDVTKIAKSLKSEDNLMLVGHLPFMEKMAAYLCVGDSDQTVIKFQNSGIVCLDKDPDETSWFIKWALVPNFV